MDYINKNKLLIAIIGVLLVLDIATVSFILMSPMRPGPPPGGGGRDPIQSFIERELEFTDEQKARYAELREEHLKKVRGSIEMDVEAKGALFDLLQRPDANEEEVRQKALEIGRIETERTLFLYEHFRAVRAICTPEQQRKFDVLIADVMKKMGPPPPDEQGPKPRPH